MTSLLERFDQPLPIWIGEINEEVFQKLSACAFAGQCKLGNTTVIREILFRFWPFIDAFPNMINRGCLRLFKEELFRNYGLELIGLFRIGFKMLLEMEKDEMNHRDLWIKTANVLGLSYDELQQIPMTEIEEINRVVGEETDPVTMLLRFVAVEIVAESGSKDFLSSRDFINALGEKGTHWFRVHVVHSRMTHEELALRLAFAIHGHEPTKEELNTVIQPVVDLFVEAAERCAELALLKQAS